ncbi:lantibiotic dehydratase C-terminal domain-containing protein [Kitasatospora sp. NPDC059327]|uniref:lantibiotic dehydratase C-terminal domain-containing protein n=1 Tax=Kitasatospora sp. NPDC059327 TaxID=3346803 RepID=UPI0036C0D79B
MTRSWVFVRILAGDGKNADHDPGDTAPALLRETVGELRQADPAGRWHFERLADGAARHLGVWLHGDENLLTELTLRLRRTAAEHGWRVRPETFAPPVAKYQSRRTLDAAAELARGSSEFALELLRDGRLDEPAAAEFALVQLTELVRLVPAPERGAFLFQCREYWRDGLPTGGPTGTGEVTPEDLRAAVDRWYARPGFADWTRAVADLTAAERTGGATPVNFLLLDHADLTHRRLGIAPGISAASADALRTLLHRDPSALESGALQTV